MNCYTLPFDDDEYDDQLPIVSREDIDHITNNTEMEYIFITHCQFANDNIRRLSEQLRINQSVINLSIIDTDIPEYAINAFSRCIKENTTLIQVFLRNNSISYNSKGVARGVGFNNTLQRFTLRNNSVGDKECKQFSWVVRFKENLKELDLRDNNIGNEGASKLS